MLADAAQIQAIQKQVADLAVADLDAVFRMVEGLPPEAARDLMIETLPGVVSTYGDVSASAAGEWFETLREREVGAAFPARLAAPVAFEPVEQSIRYSAHHLFDGTPDQMLKYLTGQTIKWVNQPSRETIIDSIDADPIGRGWQRVVRPGGCGFCRMLADRGGRYTRKSVWFASHTNCNCGAVPSWDDSIPEVDVNAYKASKRMEAIRSRAAGEGKDAVDAREILAEHRGRVREWVKDFESRGN